MPDLLGLAWLHSMRWMLNGGKCCLFATLITINLYTIFLRFVSFIYTHMNKSMSSLFHYSFCPYNPYRLKSNETNFQLAYNSIWSDTLELNSTWNQFDSSLFFISSFFFYCFLEREREKKREVFLCTFYCIPFSLCPYSFSCVVCAFHG